MPKTDESTFLKIVATLFAFYTAILSEEEIYNIVQAEGHVITLPSREIYNDLDAYQNYVVMLSWTRGSERKVIYSEFKTLSVTGGVAIYLSNPDFQWKPNDTAGLYSYEREGTSNVNIPLVVSDYYVGMNTGPFFEQVPIEMPSLGTDRFFIYFPHDDNTYLSDIDYAFHSTLENIQNSSESGFSFYWGISDVSSSTEELDVELTNALASIEFKINTSKYSGYKIKGLSLFDYAGEAGIAGEFALDPDKGVIKTEKGKTVSNIVVSKPSDGNEGNISLSILPGDYSSFDMRLFVSLASDDGSNVIVPMRYPGELKIEPGEKKVCTIEDLSPDKDAYPWYEPLEKRDYLEKCAYGPQNTYLIECKESGPSTISIDVKVRGNLLEATAPVYYGILLPSDIKGSKFLVLNDGADVYEEHPNRLIGPDYKIEVGCYGQDLSTGYFGVVAIYDKDYNILWSYMIWRYNSGDPVSEVYYPGGDFTLMDRALGARKGFANSLKDGVLGEGSAYFEWGRKDPFPWSTQVEDWYVKETPTAGSEIEYANSHPNVWLTYSANKTWFYSNQRKDLWGAENTTTSNNVNLIGHKTIYDPCPEGWRVCDYKVCAYVHSGKIFAERKISENKVQAKNAAVHLAMPSPWSDASAVAINKGNGEYDYWPYYGLMWGSSNSWTNKSKNATDYAYAYWSNSNNSVSNYKSALLMGYYTSSSWTATTSIQMADMFTVRCQKEK